MSGFSAVTYAILSKQITSALTSIADVKLVDDRTLSFTTNDGAEFPITLPTPNIVHVGNTPPDPVTQPNVELWIDTSTDGAMPIGKAILTEPIVTNVSIGSITPGMTFNAGDSIEDIIRAMLS